MSYLHGIRDTTVTRALALGHKGFFVAHKKFSNGSNLTENTDALGQYEAYDIVILTN
jgi:hypothetical protein